MDTKFFLGIGLAIVLVFAGAAVYTSFTDIPAASGSTGDREILYQVSTIDALLLGVYEGIQPVGEIRKRGDFGIGTFDALEGEMIVLDGIVYHAKADGHVSLAADSQTTPFATMTYFDRDRAVLTDSPMNFSLFSSTMAALLPSENMVYAVQMRGTFPSMKVRAIPAQHKPYALFVEAAKTQSIFTYSDTPGTVIGFYTPVFFRGLNVEGFHLHFISDDRNWGGHILDLTVPANTTVEFDITPGFAMTLPTSGDFTGVDLSQDLSRDVAMVEK
jgi:acetolactate decarboxylase